MISLVWGKRSIPIIWLTRQGKKGHFPEQVHIDLLTSLSSILTQIGIKERVVILGDGEFDGDKWVAFIQSLTWEYVFRTSLDRKVSNNTSASSVTMGILSPYQNCLYISAQNVDLPFWA